MLETVVYALLVATTVALCAATAFFIIQCVVGCLPSNKPVPDRPDDYRQPCAILVPAHNEEEGILSTLACLRAQMRVGDRLVVVADNCIDQTAALARAAGAEVVERYDETLCGKGYALAAGIRHLAQSPPPIVVIVDADCIVSPGAIDRLSSMAVQSARPVQGRYLMITPPSRQAQTALAEFAFMIKNCIRPRGLSRLGSACQLTGSGMAFPWHAIFAANLSHDHLVEDMKLGLDLAQTGLAPRYCDEAIITSPFPLSTRGQASQRFRWEKGRLILTRSALSLLLQWPTYRRPRLVVLLVDALIPPVTLLAAALTANMAFTGLSLLLGAPQWPFVATLVTALGFASVIIAIWFVHGQSTLPLAAFAATFSHVGTRLALYASLLRRRPTRWIRTDRGAGDTEGTS